MSDGEDYTPIPEEFVGMPPDINKCAAEGCKHKAEWGRSHCMWHIAKYRDEARLAWQRKQ